MEMEQLRKRQALRKFLTLKNEEDYRDDERGKLSCYCTGATILHFTPKKFPEESPFSQRLHFNITPSGRRWRLRAGRRDGIGAMPRRLDVDAAAACRRRWRRPSRESRRVARERVATVHSYDKPGKPNCLVVVLVRAKKLKRLENTRRRRGPPTRPVYSH